jgi:hypothetical protein
MHFEGFRKEVTIQLNYDNNYQEDDEPCGRL